MRDAGIILPAYWPVKSVFGCSRWFSAPSARAWQSLRLKALACRFLRIIVDPVGEWCFSAPFARASRSLRLKALACSSLAIDHAGNGWFSVFFARARRSLRLKALARRFLLIMIDHTPDAILEKHDVKVDQQANPQVQEPQM